jgi:hypothetical protein
MLPLEQPFKTYTGLDGKPLDNGYIYFGQPWQDPANVSQRVTVFWDPDGTQPAAQPLRTVNGYIVNDGGAPANVFFDGAYSELVRDSKMRQVFYAGTSDDFSIATVVRNLLADLAGSNGASLIGFIQEGVGAVKRTLQEKAREGLSVGDFGAKYDGVTLDDAAILKGMRYLQSIGGGKLYFPARSKIASTLFISGAITGGTSGYPTPTLPKITFVGNGESGIVSSIGAGDVVRLSSPSEALYFALGLENFLIDCMGNNVTAFNGHAQAGLYGPNHYIDVDGLKIVGISGAAATGMDFGTVTDSKVSRVSVQGSGAGAFIGFRIAKANVRLDECYASYCTRAFSVQALVEAAVILKGGGSITCMYALWWEPTAAFTYSSASLIEGSFLGETTNGGYIVGAGSPNNLDVGSVTFKGVQFDNYRAGQDLMTIDFGGRFAFEGCNTYYASTGLKTVDLGQYAVTTWHSNSGMSIKTGCQALVLDKVNKFPQKVVLNFYATAVPGATGNLLLSKDGSSIAEYLQAFAGSLVGISVQASQAITSGSMDFQMEINKGGVGGAFITFPASSVRTIAAGQYTFNAGDRLGVRCYKNSVIAPAPIDVCVQLTVQY